VANASAKQVATRYFDAIGARDLDGMVACWAPGALDELYGMAELVAPDGIREWFGMVFDAFPDFSMEVTDIVAYGEKAAVQWRITGTFAGPGRFEGLAPTGESVELEGIDMLTVRDGLIHGNRAFTNAAEMGRQLGAMPPAGSFGEKAMVAGVNARTAARSALRNLAERRRMANGGA
jgi:predicted ester cyclase